MKLLTEEKENKFEPFELRILVESETDLIELWHRFNIGTGSITHDYKSGYYKEIFYPDSSVNRTMIWEFLNKKLKEKNINHEK